MTRNGGKLHVSKREREEKGNRIVIMAIMLAGFLTPCLAMNAQAATEVLDRSRTYGWYDATGGDASGTTLFLDGAYSTSERNVSAYSEAIDVGYGAKGWARVWKAVECAESGAYSLAMSGHYRCIVSAVGGAEADVEFIFQIKNLDTGEIERESMFAAARTAILWGFVAEDDFYASIINWYGVAGTRYGFGLYVEAYTAGILGIAVADAWGVEHAYFNSVSISPYTATTGGGCLLEGTSIAMADGNTLPIEKVKTGMTALGYDLEARSLVMETVTLVARARVDTMVDINCGLIVVTPTDHPMYARNGTWEGGVIDPQDLRLGMELFCPMNASWTAIHTRCYIHGTFRVYEIQLTLPDNYIANGILCDFKRK